MRICDWSSDVCSSDLLDAHAVAELEKGRLGGTVQQGLHRALLGDAGVAAAALGDRSARPAFGLAVGNRAGADAAAGAEPPGSRGVGSSEVARVGKEFVSPFRTRLTPYHKKKKT